MATERAKTKANAIKHFKKVHPNSGKEIKIVRKLEKGKYEILTKGHKASSR